MSEKRLVAARIGNGRIGVIEQDIPELTAGALLVEVHNSLISPGTELGGGWRALQKEREEERQIPTPKPFGYSNSGIVIQTGEGVKEFSPGDRVACVGAGYALHADYAVVPHHLCVGLPDNVSFEQGSYAMLAATSLQALRRGEPAFGEYAGVVGLGIVGQLTAQIYQLAGNYVIGWETIPYRIEIARRWGIHAVAQVGVDDEVAITNKFTGGMGLDSMVYAFPGDATEVLRKSEQVLKRAPDSHVMGTIVIVGGVSFKYNATTTNLDFRRASRTGPGYHDEAWEFGAPYPSVFVRWNTRTNLELCLRLISEGRLNVDCLTTHRIPLENVEEELATAIDNPDGILGVVLKMKRNTQGT